MTNQTQQLTLTRKQLQEIFTNPVAVQAFENLFKAAVVSAPSNAQDAETLAEIGAAQAVEALSLISALAKDLASILFRSNADLPIVDNYVPSAALGSLAQQNAENLVLKPRALMSPPLNGDLVFEATANNLLTIRMRGTDGISRSIALTLV